MSLIALAIILLFAVVIPSVSANCSDHGHCLTCTKSSSWLSTCRWCPIDHRCHATGSLANNCHSSQNIKKPSFCPPNHQPQTSFNLQIAHLMLMYSSAAYQSRPQTPFPATTRIIQRYEYPLPDSFTSSCYLGVDETSQRIILAFRGTDPMSQLIDEILNANGVAWKGIAGAMVNKYFVFAAGGLAALYSKSLAKLRSDFPAFQLWVTGHSLGGAMAALTAVDLVNSGKVPKNQVLMYSFGEPRAGNYEFAMWYDSLVPNSYRLVNSHDIVPHLPTCMDDPNWKKSGERPCIPRDPSNPAKYVSYHHGTEIWFPSGEYSTNGVMCGYRVCLREPTNEDLSCSDGLATTTSKVDHSGYWKALNLGWCG